MYKEEEEKVMKYILLILGLLLSNNILSATNNQITYSDQKNLDNLALVKKDSLLKPWEKWSLTEQDWIKYKEHMKGPRGIWSPNLDPLTILGVEAESEEERKIYARKLAILEFQRVEKELAFQRSYDHAMKTLYPTTKIIDLSKLPNSKDKILNKTIKLKNLNKQKDRLLFFTKLNKCNLCRDYETRLLNDWVRKGGAIDIYVLDAKKDNDIRQWAKNLGISPNLVKQKKVTLNHDKGGLFLASGGVGSTPWLVIKRNNSYFKVQ